MIWAVNAAYRALLTRRAQSRPLSSSGVLTKARALAELEKNSIPCRWDQLPDDRRDLVRGQVLEVIEISERLQSFDGNRSASIAIRLLAILDDDPIDAGEPDHTGATVPIWLNEDLDELDRLGWLESVFVLDVDGAMRRVHGWRIDWQRSDQGRARKRWILEQAGRVLAADDPLVEAADWLQNPPAPPSRLIA